MHPQINPAFYLNLLRSQQNLLAVKSEFEAEGSTLEELCTLSTFCNDASVPLTIKVGGSSAKRDFSEAIEIGAKIILVPMIESTESLRLAVDNFLHFSKIFRSPTLKPLLYINIETKTAAVSSSKIKDFILSENLPVSGVVIGRSDLAASMGVHSVDHPSITSLSSNVASIFSTHGFDVTVGGSISFKSYSALQQIVGSGANAFETRKCTISISQLANGDIFKQTVTNCLAFELAWLQHKKNIISSSINSDLARINILDSRINAGLE